jgi:uncharacterized membrane protein SirB2
MDYLTVKHIHITCATLSGSLFFARYLDVAGLGHAAKKWIRIAPHLIDTLLLASALTMVFWSRQYPFVEAWLTAKVLALLLYIGLGTVALKRGKTKTVRIRTWIAALAVFSYIVAVALTKQALPHW